MIHEDAVREVRARLLPVDLRAELAEFYKAFGDGTRLGILFALAARELCVCDIAALLGLNQSTVSHQLRILKQSRLIKNRKQGKVVYYSLDDEHIKAILQTGAEHVME
ncbi:MAG: metalloregulator ArsR/SmtB family transcription factor [Clostridiales bacterium]|nr:metalloregulator ArsR/SmtB family transcription factor [Clostridiales bacterium]